MLSGALGAVQPPRPRPLTVLGEEVTPGGGVTFQPLTPSPGKGRPPCQDMTSSEMLHL